MKKKISENRGSLNVQDSAVRGGAWSTQRQARTGGIRNACGATLRTKTPATYSAAAIPAPSATRTIVLGDGGDSGSTVDGASGFYYCIILQPKYMRKMQ